MAKQQKPTTAPADNGLKNVSDYRFPEAPRKNNPPAKIAAEGHVPLIPKAEYLYSPRRPPELRFDPTGGADELPELLAKATKQKLTEAEAWALAEALRVHEPWLEWAGKREAKSFAVDPVALHIHERVSAQAILKVAAREDVNRSLFADPEQEYNEAVQFYKHDVDWSNRLILGDSLQVMSSLARREDLAGKVQLIYFDPPYGIKFASNFQSEIGKRDVKDKDADLTREPEMVKAYRDTWSLGVHSYLAYLRDRLIVAKELLTDTGSIFVQIGDENAHRVRSLMDEVFGAGNFCSFITVKKTGGLGTDLLKNVADYLLWFAKDKLKIKYRQLYAEKVQGEGETTGARYDQVALPDGSKRSLTTEERADPALIPEGTRTFQLDNLASSGTTPSCVYDHAYQGVTYRAGGQRSWKTNLAGMTRLSAANRLHGTGTSLRYVRFLDDFAAFEPNNVWTDVAVGTSKIYVVQTPTSVAERCLLMTTDPGDLVLDPTCGSGTTAYGSEQWGRRWITIDTSRVAIAAARQRLLTAKFEYFKLKGESNGVAAGFRCKMVPHITLRSIAQNSNLDPIFAKHETIFEAKLAAANAALNHVSDRLRTDQIGRASCRERV